MKWTVYLTPTEHRRINEFVGLLLVTVAVLISLSLVSFDATDPSFNISRNVRFEDQPANLIGVVGSHASDLLFQAIGYAGLLLPVFLGIYAFHWLASWSVGTVGTRLAGMSLMVLTLATGLALSPAVPRIGGQIPAGGGGGQLLAEWLSATLNPLGTVIVLVASFLVSLLLATTFSFQRTIDFLRPRLRFVAVWQQQAVGWLEEQSRERVRRRIERKKAPALVTQPEPKAEKPKDVPPPRASKRRVAEQPSLIPIDEPVVTEMEPVPLKTVNFPSPELLLPPEDQIPVDEEELRERADQIEEKTKEFEVVGQVQQIHPGPVVTTFEFKPEPGIKYSKVTGLDQDLCLALEAESIRIDRLAGKSTVGIEVPNPDRATITLRELIESPEYLKSKALLPLALGKDITGRIIVSDLHRMPHLLIAGSTGTGKSVSINSLILSLLFRSKPDRVKLIMIDPKRLELGLYQDIPHLLVPVVTEPVAAQNALKWAVGEMEGRYKKLAKRGVRTLEAYNEHIKQLPIPGFGEEEEEDREQLPYIVIVIDELADLMMVASREVEESITRLAQMARAVGIHLILATQRPSVDVITGLIKANFPARISFRVATKIDSRTILDANGAESLLGRGDMLFLPPGSSAPHARTRPDGDRRRGHTCSGLSQSSGQAFIQRKHPRLSRRAASTDGTGRRHRRTLRHCPAPRCRNGGKASTSALQRRLRIGYGRAASLLDAMEADGMVGPPEGSRPREVLVKGDYFEEIDNHQ